MSNDFVLVGPAQHLLNLAVADRKRPLWRGAGQLAILARRRSLWQCHKELNTLSGGGESGQAVGAVLAEGRVDLHE